jgi:hypothetical protein
MDKGEKVHPQALFASRSPFTSPVIFRFSTKTAVELE